MLASVGLDNSIFIWDAQTSGQFAPSETVKG
jgi:hypothetical protein